MVKINLENFSKVLSLLENYQNNRSNNDLEKNKKALEKIIRDAELYLGKSNSEFTEYLIGSGINFQDIFDEIDEFIFQEEVKNLEKSSFSLFFTYYFFSLADKAEFINSREEIEELISILEVFRASWVFPLPEVYQENQARIEDIIEIFSAKKLSLSGEEQEETKGVISSSSKGKQVKRKDNDEDFDWINSLPLEDLKETVKQQVKIIDQKNQEIDEKNQEIKQLKEQLASTQIQVNPK